MSGDLEAKFDSIFGDRIGSVETQMDGQMSSINKLFDLVSGITLKQEKHDTNIKDAVTLLKTLDGRFHSSNTSHS